MMRLLLILGTLWYLCLAENVPKHFEILNDSGAKLKVYWIDPATGQQQPFSTLYNGAHVSVNSYVNHTFVVRQTDPDNKESRINYVKVGEKDDQVVAVRKNLEIKYMDHEASCSNEAASSLHEKCLQEVQSMAGQNANLTMDLILQCYEDGLVKILEKKNEEISFQDKTRRQLSSMLENYTCADTTLPTTTPKETRKFGYNDTLYNVGILHELPDSQIHILPNFITEDECRAFQEAASRVLHRGTVADGSGGSRLSENRKAWQAGLRVPWEKEADGDLMARYTRRMYAYANYATGYNMDVAGQEDIMSIQYFGEGGEHPKGNKYTPETPDRYMPHCDGDCAGLPHKHGTRVATMVSYCTVPDEGGYTTFQNANVHVKPQLHASVFFSYMNPVTTEHDTGWTSHSGCPVTKGTKRIVVHWMRVGVSEEEPWDSFNTLGIPKHLAEDC